jgi:hypothetical protein
VHSFSWIDFSAATLVHSLLCIHFTAFTLIHSFECIHLSAFTWVYSLECIHLSAFTWVHSLVCIHLSAFTWVHSLECIHLSKYTLVHSQIPELRIPISGTLTLSLIHTYRQKWAVYRVASQLKTNMFAGTRARVILYCASIYFCTKGHCQSPTQPQLGVTW